jgi:hypothetical protein
VAMDIYVFGSRRLVKSFPHLCDQLWGPSQQVRILRRGSDALTEYVGSQCVFMPCSMLVQLVITGCRHVPSKPYLW